MKDNPYKLLLVDPQATDGVIKAAYRALMKSEDVHPDRGGSLEKAQALNQAYETLLSTTKRAELDRRLAEEAKVKKKARKTAKNSQPPPKKGKQSEQRAQPATLVVCLHCGTVNELQHPSLVPIAKCGQCTRPFTQIETKRAEQDRPQSAKNTKNTKRKADKPDKEFARYMYDKQLYMRALEDYRKLMQIEPKDMNNVFMAGMCYYKLSHYEDARRYFITCLQENQNDFEATLYFGKSLFKENKFSAAIPYFRKATDINQSSLKPKSLLGLCLYKSAHYPQAIEVLNQVIMKNPALDQAIYYMAMCHYKTYQFERARSCFLLSLQVFPGDERLVEMLEHCERNIRFAGGGRKRE